MDPVNDILSPLNDWIAISTGFKPVDTLLPSYNLVSNRSSNVLFTPPPEGNVIEDDDESPFPFAIGTGMISVPFFSFVIIGKGTVVTSPLTPLSWFSFLSLFSFLH